MTSQKNEFLDEICNRLNSNGWIVTEQPLKNLGFHKISVSIRAEEFATSIHNVMEQCSMMIENFIEDRLWKSDPLQYKHGAISNLELFLPSASKSFRWMLIGSSIHQYLAENQNTRYLLTHAKFADSELVLLKTFNKSDENLKGRIALLMSPVTVYFHSFKFENERLTISFSIKLPDDSLIIDACKE